MAATIISEPTEEPVDVASAKLHARIDTADDDAAFARMIVAARRHFERETNRSLVTRTYRLDLAAFPHHRGAIRLPYGPVSSVDDVSYIDSAGVETTLAEDDDYLVDVTSDVATIVPTVALGCWPVAPRRPGAVSITYRAGYGAAAAVPEDAVLAILQIASHWYANREAVGGQLTEVSMAAQRVIETLRINQLA